MIFLKSDTLHYLENYAFSDRGTYAKIACFFERYFETPRIAFKFELSFNDVLIGDIRSRNSGV